MFLNLFQRLSSKGSYLTRRIIKPVGVKTSKKMAHSKIGEKIIARILPKKNQAKFNGLKIIASVNPSIKKVIVSKAIQRYVS